MPTASALLAPVAPVSTGTGSAAPGATQADIGLFSSKIAGVLDAALGGEQITAPPAGRLTSAQSLGALLVQACSLEGGRRIRDHAVNFSNT